MFDFPANLSGLIYLLKQILIQLTIQNSNENFYMESNAGPSKVKMHVEKGISLTPHGHFETHVMSSFQTIGAKISTAPSFAFLTLFHLENKTRGFLIQL